MRSINRFAPAIIIGVIAIVYIIFSWIVSHGDMGRTHLAYYNYILSAFAHRRVFVTPFLSTVDLAYFNDMWFLYWGPAPAVFIAPFYLLAKTQTSDVIYTLTAGIINVGLFYFVIKAFDRAFELQSKLRDLLFILVNFAFISPHFYLSLQGRIWHTNQVIAVFYMLCFLYFYFRFWLNLKKLSFLTLAVIFLNLAVLSRYTMVFYFSLLIPLFWDLFKSKDRGIFKRSLVIVFLITSAFLTFTLSYNWVRFEKPWETGIRFVDIRSSEDRIINEAEKKHLLGVEYLSHNFEVYFLNGLEFTTQSPFVKIEKEGNSIWSLYPLVFLTPALLLRRFFLGKKYSLFLMSALFGVVVPIIFYLMFYLATGWAQLGTRYFLDVVPILYVLMLIIAKRVPKPIKLVILLYGILVNMLGAVAFYAI